MSEQTNIDLMKAIYGAFNRGDLQSVLANIAPDAEWVNYGPDSVPYCGNFNGRSSDFFKAMGESMTGLSVAIERYIASGDFVATEGRLRATARGTGVAIDSPISHFFTFRGGKIASWRGYSDTAALAAAQGGQAASA